RRHGHRTQVPRRLRAREAIDAARDDPHGHSGPIVALRPYEVRAGVRVPLTGHGAGLWDPREDRRDRRHHVEISDPRKVTRGDPTLYDGEVVVHALDRQTACAQLVEYILRGRVKVHVHMQPRALLPRWRNQRWRKGLRLRLTRPREAAQVGVDLLLRGCEGLL